MGFFSGGKDRCGWNSKEQYVAVKVNQTLLKVPTSISQIYNTSEDIFHIIYLEIKFHGQSHPYEYARLASNELLGLLFMLS